MNKQIKQFLDGVADLAVYDIKGITFESIKVSRSLYNDLIRDEHTTVDVNEEDGTLRYFGMLITCDDYPQELRKFGRVYRLVDDDEF